MIQYVLIVCFHCFAQTLGNGFGSRFDETRWLPPGVQTSDFLPPGSPPGAPLPGFLDKSIIERTTGSDCKDARPDICATYSDDCDKYKYLSMYCPVTCNTCVGESPCKDNAPSCEKVIEYCNFEAVQDECQKTCKLCDGAGSSDKGTWSEYGPWSDCSKTCGPGTRRRIRTCEGGEECEGKNEEEASCNDQTCRERCRDVDKRCFMWYRYCDYNSFIRANCKRTCRLCYRETSVWRNWSDWSDCSRSCGRGSQERQRTCSGSHCSGDSRERRTCNAHTCPESLLWSAWSQFSQCSATCGNGRKSRGRTCIGDGNCLGSSTDEDKCFIKSCSSPSESCSDKSNRCRRYKNKCQRSSRIRFICKKTCGNCNTITVVDSSGSWGSYDNWSTCTKPCGTGEQRRDRVCINGECRGTSYQKRECNTQRCRVQEVWGDWSDWEMCSKTCGNGDQTRTRRCIQGECRGRLRETRDCNYGRCQVVPVWEDWTRWSKCSRSCGGGQKTRKRTCRKGNCEGPTSQTEECNTHQCEVTAAKWGDWEDWGSCSADCGDGTQIRRRRCERGSCEGSSLDRQNCRIGNCNDPVFNDWTEWGPCSKNCGTGVEKRTRRCVAGRCKDESQSRLCKGDDCDTPTYKCSVQCGVGHNFTADSSGYRTYDSCRMQECPSETCQSDEEPMKDDPEKKCCKFTNNMSCGLTGYNPIITGRILGGTDAEPKEFPWQVLIRGNYNRNIQYCGGTIVSNRWILTAAHCIQRDHFTYPARSLSVAYGIVHVTASVLKDIYNVDRREVHPSFNFPIDDIAMLKVKTKMMFNSYVQPACLFHGAEPKVDSSCLITGFGLTTNSNKKLADTLQKATVEYLPYEVCENGYKSSPTYIGPIRKNKNKLVCAGSISSGQDTCTGDSGGPLVCQIKDSCRFTLVGITSFGPTICATKRKPGMYTKVSHYKRWIDDTMKL